MQALLLSSSQWFGFLLEPIGLIQTAAWTMLLLSTTKDQE
jgi:hypothetical protein